MSDLGGKLMNIVRTAGIVLLFLHAQISMEAQISIVNVPCVVPLSSHRIARGIGRSPYPWYVLPRYMFNYVTNGRFSCGNHEKNNDTLLLPQGSFTVSPLVGRAGAGAKIVFLGDFMVSSSGQPPELAPNIASLIKSANIIVVNIESPVTDGPVKPGRCGTSLKFEMHIDYVRSLYEANPQATWVLSVANNHAFDTSDATPHDITGLQKTIDVLHTYLPNVQVIGAGVHPAKSVLALQVADGPRIGIIAWTQVMNCHARHKDKPLVYGEDITPELIQSIKKEGGFDFLIGFPHGGEEQRCQPLLADTIKWKSLTGPLLFDVVVATGPHVIQPAHTHNGRPILYSIGNIFSPRGMSQTKVGCIPEIQLRVSTESSSQCSYKVHFLQQKEQKISLFELTDTGVWYPDIVARLRKTWPTLFTDPRVKVSSPVLKAGLTAVALGLTAYISYRVLQTYKK